MRPECGALLLTLRSGGFRSRGADKLAVLEPILHTPGKTIVFCNTIKSARAVEHSLREAGQPSVCLHGEMMQAARAEAWAQFMDDEARILVCTDLVARGLDTLDVKHVVNFDFPGTATEYIHRR